MRRNANRETEERTHEECESSEKNNNKATEKEGVIKNKKAVITCCSNSVTLVTIDPHGSLFMSNKQRLYDLSGTGYAAQMPACIVQKIPSVAIP